MVTRILLGAAAGTVVGAKVAELSGQSWLGLLVGVCLWTAFVGITGAGESA